MSEKQEMLELANRIRDIAYSGVNNFDDFSSYKLDLIQDYAKLLQASLGAPSHHPRGEPVAWQWWSGIHLIEMTSAKSKADKWIADGNDVRALYAAPPPAGADAVRMIGKVSDILRRRAAGYEARATAIFNGRIMADELRENARRVEALADSILPSPQPQEKPAGDQT